MKLVRSVKLFFREGNSDKTYEIDLCETGPDQYVVNFRYGKRNGPLKDGTKTATPVNLTAATTIFDALEMEKRSKGYLGINESAQVIPDIPAPEIAEELDERAQAILRRLQDALDGTNSFKTEWPVSRVIWKAGEYRIKAALPQIAKLAERGNAIQRYSAIWAIARCRQQQSIPMLKAYYENKAYPGWLRQIALHGMLMAMPQDEQAKLIQYLTEGLDPAFQEAISRRELLPMLRTRITTLKKQQYPELEDLYAIATTNEYVHAELLRFLEEVPLAPSHFRHIRHLFKQAELRDDHAFTGLLAVRFEKEDELFTRDYEAPKELKQANSSLAYSNRTRSYLNRRTLRHLAELGDNKSPEFVQLATALLIQYRQERDFEPASTENYPKYVYQDSRWVTYNTQMPESYTSVYLNYLLKSNARDMHLNRSAWHYYQMDPHAFVATASKIHEPNSGGILKTIMGFFGKKKTPPPPPPVPAPLEAPVSPVKHLDLWRQSPRAWVKLLVYGRMDMAIRFALVELKAHPEYQKIRREITIPEIAGILASHHPEVQQFGLDLAKERYNPQSPSFELFLALLNSQMPEARQLGFSWTQHHREACFADVEFLRALIFNPYADVRALAQEHLPAVSLSQEKAEALCGKVIAWLLSLSQVSPVDNIIINEGCSILEQQCRRVLAGLSFPVIEDLLKSNVGACQAFAARLILLKQHSFRYDELPDSFILNLASNSFAPVRDAALSILQMMSPTELVKRPELILQIVLADESDVRQKVRAVLTHITRTDQKFAVWLANELTVRLMRKETSEGLHRDIANTLGNELIEYLHEIDTTTALRLLHANYRPAQEFGVLVLEKHIPADALTLKQVIAAGNHELEVVRSWSHRFYNNNVARIKQEANTAINLLDAIWEHSRQFAREFFREQFTDSDWTPELLMAIADSVTPEIQAFGRELLTRFFKSDDGPAYLLKLSQHPAAGMQSFATHYLETYASGNLAYLQDLEPFFRTVLSRVNKSRPAKERIFAFLEKEALRSEDAAILIGNIITLVSATVSIGDKATCIAIMQRIRQQYPQIELPIRIREAELRTH